MTISELKTGFISYWYFTNFWNFWNSKRKNSFSKVSWNNRGTTIYKRLKKDWPHCAPLFLAHCTVFCTWICLIDMILLSNLLLSSYSELKYIKSRFFKNRELYWSDLPQNSNFGREFSKIWGSNPRWGRSNFFVLCCFHFHILHKKLNIDT